MRGLYRISRPSSAAAAAPSPEGEGKSIAGSHFLSGCPLFCFGVKMAQMRRGGVLRRGMDCSTMKPERRGERDVLGILNTDTGCSIDTNAGGFIIRHSGLYRISYDVTFTAGAAGTEVLQGMKDTAALPCMTASATVAANEVSTFHAETVVYIPVCCGSTPTISAVLSGVAGTVTHVCASVVKLA